MRPTPSRPCLRCTCEISKPQTLTADSAKSRPEYREMNASRKRRLAAVAAMAEGSVDSPPSIALIFTDCTELEDRVSDRAESIGRFWIREPHEKSNEFRQRVFAEIPNRNGVPTLVVFFPEDARDRV